MATKDTLVSWKYYLYNIHVSIKILVNQHQSSFLVAHFDREEMSILPMDPWEARSVNITSHLGGAHEARVSMTARHGDVLSRRCV
jgi:hypothetical protein